MNYILFDEPESWSNLLPFTFTRPVSQIRVGILTIAEKWEKYLGKKVSYQTQNYLQPKFPLISQEDNIFINATVLPNPQIVAEIKKLDNEVFIKYKNKTIAYRTTQKIANSAPTTTIELNFEPLALKAVTDIFLLNGSQIQADFELLTKGRISAPISDKYTAIYNLENIFIEEGVKIKACVLNAENGVIYLGKNSQVSEGAIIQGNFALGENSVINLGGKMRPNTSIGPYCKVGGEISNSVVFGYSNKSHEGFLGNSVLGEWCNLGADTNNSNLKNNYSQVKIWNFLQKDFVDTGLQFCGLLMGDHSKAGINTMFNTGTVVGVSASVFGGGFPPKFVPSFAWGGSENMEIFDLEKAMETAQKVLERREKPFDSIEKAIFEEIFRRR